MQTYKTLCHFVVHHTTVEPRYDTTKARLLIEVTHRPQSPPKAHYRLLFFILRPFWTEKGCLTYSTDRDLRPQHQRYDRANIFIQSVSAVIMLILSRSIK